MKPRGARWRLAGLATALGLFAAPQALAEADMILTNGKIVTVDAQDAVRQAIAIADGKILAVGSNDEVRALAGTQSLIVDLGGRTVIPGLIDSHIHAIRAAQSFATEVSWIDAGSLAFASRRGKPSPQLGSSSPEDGRKSSLPRSDGRPRTTCSFRGAALICTRALRFRRTHQLSGHPG